MKKLRAAYEAIESLYLSESVASNQCSLIQRAQVLKLQNEELIKRKGELSRFEVEAEMTAISLYQTEVGIPLIACGN